MKTHRKRSKKKRGKQSKKRSINTALLSSTKMAVKKSRTRVKKQLLSLVNTTKKNIKHLTRKVDTTMARKISALVKGRF